MNNGDSFCYYTNFPLWTVKDKKRAVQAMCIYMIDRLQKVFNYDGLDNDFITFDKRKLELQLMLFGHSTITKVNGKLYAFRTSLGGVPDAYYMPTQAIVANPYLKFDAALQIGEQCEVIANDAMYIGLQPILTKYATLIVEAEITLNQYAINSRTPVIITGDNDRTRESAKLFVKHLIDGDIDVIADVPMLDGVRSLPFSAGNGNRITDLIEYRQYLWGTFLNEIGLKAAYNMKREALSDDEVSVNDLSLTPLIENMLECRQDGLDRVNKMYGTNITVKLSGAWEDLRKDIENDLTPDPEQEPVEDEPEEKDGDDDVSENAD